MHSDFHDGLDGFEELHRIAWHGEMEDDFRMMSCDYEAMKAGRLSRLCEP